MAGTVLDSLPVEIIRLIFKEILSSYDTQEWRETWRLRFVNTTFAREIRQVIFDSDVFLHHDDQRHVPGWRIMAEYLDHLMNSQKKIGIQLRSDMFEIAEIMLHNQSARYVSYEQRQRNMIRLLCEACAKSIKVESSKTSYLRAGTGVSRDPRDHAIVAAASAGDMVILEKLLGSRDPWLVCSELFGTVLSAAAQNGAPVVGFLLSKYPLRPGEERSPEDEIAMVAAYYGQLDVLMLLIDRKLAHFQFNKETLHRRRNSFMNNTMYTAILRECVRGNQRKIISFLTSDQIIHDALEICRPRIRDLVLYYACSFDRLKIARDFLDKGADPLWPNGRITAYEKAIEIGVGGRFRVLLRWHHDQRVRSWTKELRARVQRDGTSEQRASIADGETFECLRGGLVRSRDFVPVGTQ